MSESCIGYINHQGNDSQGQAQDYLSCQPLQILLMDLAHPGIFRLVLIIFFLVALV